MCEIPIVCSKSFHKLTPCQYKDCKYHTASIAKIEDTITDLRVKHPPQIDDCLAREQEV